MIRLIVFILVGYFAYRFMRSLISSAGGGRADRIGANSVRRAEQADLVRDPQCGIYFMKEHAVRANAGGETLYFCSPACREAYLAQSRNR